MYCKNCGNNNADDVLFCTQCGLNMAEQNKSDSSNETTGTTPPQTIIPPTIPPQPQPPQFQQQPPIQPGNPGNVNSFNGFQQPVPKPVKQKKRNGCLTFILGFLAAIVLLFMAVYVFVPGLLRPFDLGVKSSEAAYKSALQKLNYSKDSSPVSGSVGSYKNVYGAPQAIDVALTSEEITSFMTVNRPPYYALSNTQIRINADNTIDAAARVDMDYVFDKILGGKISKEQAIEKFPALRFLPSKVNLSCNMEGRIVDNTVENFELNKISLNGIPVPSDLLASVDANNELEKTLSEFIVKSNESTKASYDLIEAKNGTLVMKGQFPSSIIREPVQ